MTNPEQRSQGGPESEGTEVPPVEVAALENKPENHAEEPPLSKDELDVLLGTGATPQEIRAMSLEEARRLAKDIPERERETKERVESITGISDEEAHRRLAKNTEIEKDSLATPENIFSKDEELPLANEDSASVDKDKMSRSERREAYTKKWEDMTEEEQKAKYEKTFEIRGRLHEMQKARANLAVLENELSNRTSLWGKVKEKLPGKKDTSLEDLKVQALRSELNYKEKRAEYVGAKAWRAMTDSKRLTEDRVREREKGNFEKFRKGWRWMGDKNVEALLTKFGKAPKSKWGKIAARSLSLRTAVAMGLMASGGVAGFAGVGAAGTVALGMRRAWSGIGTGVGLYDLMRNVSAKKETAITKEDIGKMNMAQLEEKKASFESLAMFNGEKIVSSPEYYALRKAYVQKAEDLKKGESESVKSHLDAAMLQNLDDASREAIEARRKKETRFKILGLGAGLGSMVLSHVLFDKVIKEKVGGNITPDDVSKAVEGDVPALTQEQFQEAVNSDGTIVNDISEAMKRKAPILTPEQFQTAKTNGPIILETVNPASEISVDIPETVEGLSAAVESSAETGQFIATIEHGSNIWDSAKQMIKDGTITEAQFMEAWTNPESVVELPDGSLSHISEVGLVHEGDQVVFLAGSPPRFTACDSVKDIFKMASNAEYAKMLVNKGVQLPEWLKESVVARMPSTQEISIDADALFTMKDADFVDAAQQAGQTGGDIAISEYVSSVAQEVPVGASPTDSQVPFPGDHVETGTSSTGSQVPLPGEAAEKVGPSATDSQVPFPGEDLPLVEPPAGTPNHADVINAASHGSLDVKEAIMLEGHQVQFVYDSSGNVADLVYSSTMNSQDRARFVGQAVREYLDDGYIRSLERTVPDSLEHIEMGRKIAYAQEAAAEIAVYNRALAATDPNSPEFYFLKYRISEFVHFTEKQILDARIFNRRSLSAALRR